jgi:ABC-type sugar transport system permease subunit
MFQNPSFIQTAENTFLFSLVYVVGVMVLGLVLALFLNRKAKGIGFSVRHSIRPSSLRRWLLASSGPGF